MLQSRHDLHLQQQKNWCDRATIPGPSQTRPTSSLDSMAKRDQFSRPFRTKMIFFAGLCCILSTVLVQKKSTRCCPTDTIESNWRRAVFFRFDSATAATRFALCVITHFIRHYRIHSILSQTAFLPRPRHLTRRFSRNPYSAGRIMSTLTPGHSRCKSETLNGPVVGSLAATTRTRFSARGDEPRLPTDLIGRMIRAVSA